MFNVFLNYKLFDKNWIKIKPGFYYYRDSDKILQISPGKNLLSLQKHLKPTLADLRQQRENIRKYSQLKRASLLLQVSPLPPELVESVIGYAAVLERQPYSVRGNPRLLRRGSGQICDENGLRHDMDTLGADHADDANIRSASASDSNISQ